MAVLQGVGSGEALDWVPGERGCGWRGVGSAAGGLPWSGSRPSVPVTIMWLSGGEIRSSKSLESGASLVH